jgi:hypothetical protein
VNILYVKENFAVKHTNTKAQFQNAALKSKKSNVLATLKEKQIAFAKISEENIIYICMNFL